MELSAECFFCILKKEYSLIESYDDEVKKAQHMKNVLKTLADCPRETSSPLVVKRINDMHREMFSSTEDFSTQKDHFNRTMLMIEKTIDQKINASEDPLKCALQYSRAGNYIDLQVLGEITDKNLLDTLAEAQKDVIDNTEYSNFIQDLSQAKSFVLLTDNAGEIVMDKLLIRQISRQFPQINIFCVVRGMYTVNDATKDDALAIGLNENAKIIPNGTDIPGTEIEFISEEARIAIMTADVILSKGQGNFETLVGCGENIYYLFLNKCGWFMHMFKTERFKGMFVNERRIGMTKFIKDLA